MRLFGLKTYILSQISHTQSHFESLRQYYFGKPYVRVSKLQSHPECQGDLGMLGQGLTVNISECNSPLELSVYYVALTWFLLIPI